MQRHSKGINQNGRTNTHRKNAKTVENLKETQQIGIDSDIDVSEQLVNQLLEIEQLLGWDSSEPED